MEDIQGIITQGLGKIVGEITNESMEVQLEIPQDPTHGDFTTNIALVFAKKLKKNPMEVAGEISSQLRVKSEEFGIEKIEIAKPGFINFWMKQDLLINNLQQVLNGEKKPVKSSQKKNKGTIIVEYSSPNIAKPFTVGHLRSTIIGDAIANILEFSGWDVKRDNHLGDWGTQFGKQIAALKFIDYKAREFVNNNLNDVENLKKNIDLIEKSARPVKLLVEFYILFHKLEEKHTAFEGLAREEFKELELSKETDEERIYSNRWIWKKCIEWSLREFDQIYKQLNISFTENDGMGYGESFFEKRMMFVLHELEREKLLKVGEEGAKIVEFPESTKLPPLMILKKDGTSLYATRDLATDRFRLEKYGKDVVIINEVGIEQSLYFKQLYELEVMLGWFRKEQRIHIGHGHYRFKDSKMSTRKGNVIWLEDILQFAENKAYDLIMQTGVDIVGHEIRVKEKKIIGGSNEIEKLKLQIAIGALKWNDLKRSYGQDIVFDWDEILNMQGNSGPYLQYTYARTQSVLDRVKSYELSGKSLELNGEESLLLRKLFQFDDIIKQAAKHFAPNILCNYLFELAQLFNNFYQKHKIIGNDNEQFRLSLTAGVGSVIKQGLQLLGIQAPKKM